MGLGKREEGGNTTYVRAAGGAFWVTKNVDKKHEDYIEEQYEKVEKDKDGNTVFGTRRGYKYGSLAGKIQSVFFKDGEYGEFMNVYLEDPEDGALFCFSQKVDRAWGAYSIAKRMMIALLVANLDEPLTLNISSSKDGEYTNVTFWVSQKGKNLVLNPEADEDSIDDNKQIRISEEVMDLLGAVRTKTKEERADMSKSKKERAREDELEDLKEIVLEVIINDLNATMEANREAKKSDSKEDDGGSDDDKAEGKEKPKKETKATKPKKEKEAVDKEEEDKELDFNKLPIREKLKAIQERKNKLKK